MHNDWAKKERLKQRIEGVAKKCPMSRADPFYSLYVEG
jgi:hypothetical protein